MVWRGGPMPPSSGKYKPLAALAHIIAYCELLRISQQQAITNDSNRLNRFLDRL
jgi:hypothetical protein